MAVGLDLTELSGFQTKAEDFLDQGVVTNNGDGTITLDSATDPVTGVPGNLPAGTSISFSAFNANNANQSFSFGEILHNGASVNGIGIGGGFVSGHGQSPHLVGWNSEGLLFSYVGQSVGGPKLEYAFLGEPSAALQPDGLPTNAIFNQSLGDVPAGFAALCFADGTSVGTPSGGIAVEDMKAGDEVLTVSGKARRVVWVGEMLARPTKHPRPHEVNPVCIRAGAFGDGLPVRDLRVSPGHALYVDGALVRALQLVNNATIVQEEVERIRYFHVELESHDVLLAEGLPCESYLDDGNRSSFANRDEAILLYGRVDPIGWEKACAPWIDEGAQLEALRSRLHARAEATGFEVSVEPGLHFVVDGARLEPFHTIDNRFWFQVPASKGIELGSHADVLTHVVPGAGDGRRLGVAVSDLRVNGTAVALSDGEIFGAGFYEVETHKDRAWRWMDGAAALGLVSDRPALVEIDLHMVAPTWKRRAPALRLVQAANG
ncbi:MAG: Hint domain-containing protein [Methylovirgula sp.]|uniref:Hint domain-containing protein n=1 Tax=Methylovirgula sp. TaxID=1978224 RepID=UPI0030763E45